MKIIDRYILKEIKMPILFGVSLFTFIFLIEIIVSLMENIIVKGISAIEVIRILSFYLPPILSQTIPMGFFLGTMLTFSKFTSTSEATAMSSMGISLKRILQPILKISVVITLFIFFLQEIIIPKSFLKLQELTLRIAYENPVFQLKDRTLMNEVERYSIYINSIDRETNEAKSVLIFQNEDDGEYPTILLSKKAYWTDANIVLENANFFNFDENGKVKVKGDFKRKSIPLSTYFKMVEIKIKDVEAMSVIQLIKSLKGKSKEEQLPYIIEINRKMAIPLSTILLAVLGVLFSIGHHRSGKGASFGISLGVIFTYIMLLNIGVVVSNKGIVSPYIAIWTPNLILLLLTISIYKKKAGER